MFSFGGSSTSLNNPAEQVKPISGDKIMAFLTGADPLAKITR
jgi:hypothetical protein